MRGRSAARPACRASASGHVGCCRGNIAEDHGRGQAMLVSGEEARGARLAKKAETRGMTHIGPLLPAGTDALEGLQSRRTFPPDEAQ